MKDKQKITATNGMTVIKETLSPGNGTLAIDASRLRPGSYQYTLWVNGEKADSKTMIIVK
jgi:hypothetical protein